MTAAAPAVRKRRNHCESAGQRAVIRWARYRAATCPELGLLHAIPNGGHRGKVTAAIMKAEGVLAGIPDLFLPVANCDEGYHGLYIEMKAARGRLSEEQRRVQHRLIAQGYKVAVCWTWAAAVRELEEYLDLEPTVSGWEK